MYWNCANATTSENSEKPFFFSWNIFFSPGNMKVNRAISFAQGQVRNWVKYFKVAMGGKIQPSLMNFRHNRQLSDPTLTRFALPSFNNFGFVLFKRKKNLESKPIFEARSAFSRKKNPLKTPKFYWKVPKRDKKNSLIPPIQVPTFSRGLSGCCIETRSMLFKGN